MTSSMFGALLLAAASFSLVACTVTADRSVSVQRTMDSLGASSGGSLGQIEGPVSLEVRTRNGFVKVRTEPGATGIEVEARLRASGRTSEAARARVESMGVEIRVQPDGIVSVLPTIPGSWKSGDSVSLDIVVPALASVNIKTSNGSVTIGGTTHMSQIVTSNGSVRATDCSGGLHIETSNGSVNVQEHDGPLDVRSSNGRLSISLADGATDAFNVRTSNGSIAVEVTSDWSGQIAANTSNGRIVLRDGRGTVVRSGRSAELVLGAGGEVSKVKSSNGSIEVEVRSVAH